MGLWTLSGDFHRGQKEEREEVRINVAMSSLLWSEDGGGKGRRGGATQSYREDRCEHWPECHYSSCRNRLTEVAKAETVPYCEERAVKEKGFLSEDGTEEACQRTRLLGKECVENTEKQIETD